MKERMRMLDGFSSHAGQASTWEKRDRCSVSGRTSFCLMSYPDEREWISFVTAIVMIEKRRWTRTNIFQFQRHP
jgi:hypothetical protein